MHSDVNLFNRFEILLTFHLIKKIFFYLRLNGYMIRCIMTIWILMIRFNSISILRVNCSDGIFIWYLRILFCNLLDKLLDILINRMLCIFIHCGRYLIVLQGKFVKVDFFVFWNDLLLKQNVWEYSRQKWNLPKNDCVVFFTILIIMGLNYVCC